MAIPAAAVALLDAMLHKSDSHHHHHNNDGDGKKDDGGAAGSGSATASASDLNLVGSLSEYAGLVSSDGGDASSAAGAPAGSVSMTAAAASAANATGTAGVSEMEAVRTNDAHRAAIKNAASWYGFRNNSGGGGSDDHHHHHDNNHSNTSGGGNNDKKTFVSAAPMLVPELVRRVASFAARDIASAVRLSNATARYRVLLFNDSPALWTGLVARHEQQAETLVLRALRLCIGIELATTLILCGVSVYATDQWDATVMHHAARFCAVRGANDLLRFLLKRKAVVNVRDAVGRTPLHIAANYSKAAKVIDFLVREHEGDLLMLDDSGYSPLHYAAQDGHLDVCKAIVALADVADVPLFLTTHEGKTALDVAEAHGRSAVVEFLKEAMQAAREKKQKKGAAAASAAATSMGSPPKQTELLLSSEEQQRQERKADGAAGAAEYDAKSPSGSSSYPGGDGVEMESVRNQQSAFW